MILMLLFALEKEGRSENSAVLQVSVTTLCCSGPMLCVQHVDYQRCCCRQHMYFAKRMLLETRSDILLILRNVLCFAPPLASGVMYCVCVLSLIRPIHSGRQSTPFAYILCLTTDRGHPSYGRNNALQRQPLFFSSALKQSRCDSISAAIMRMRATSRL